MGEYLYGKEVGPLGVIRVDGRIGSVGVSYFSILWSALISQKSTALVNLFLPFAK